MVALHPDAAERPERLFTREDYRAMAASGILREDDRVELIDGRIINMMPIGPWHVASGIRLNRFLSRHYHGAALVSLGNPVGLGDKSEPQPDIAVLRRRDDFYATAHPGPEDVILLIEIADSTRHFDLIEKRNLYAAHGIREYWVVDGGRKCVHVFRNPRDGEFTDSHIHTGADIIPLPDCEGKTIAVTETGAAD